MTARVLRKERRPGIACMDPARDLCALTGPQAVHLMSVTGVSRVEADKMAPKVTAVGVTRLQEILTSKLDSCRTPEKGVSVWIEPERRSSGDAWLAAQSRIADVLDALQ